MGLWRGKYVSIYIRTSQSCEGGGISDRPAIHSFFGTACWVIIWRRIEWYVHGF